MSRMVKDIPTSPLLEGMTEDCISRQAAIDALGERPLAWEHGEYEEGLIAKWESDVEAIKDLPSAQPLSEVDLIELQDRFGEFVRYVVEDMISGKGERWKKKT